MTKDEFFQLCKEKVRVHKDTWPDKEYIEISWIIGGWRDAYLCDIEAEDEPSFDELDDILEIVRPNITYLQYKKLFGKTVVSTRSETDYYNTYEKKHRILYLEELYDFLFPNV